MNYLNQLLDVPSMDPDDARRRKLLNIILMGLLMLGFAALLVAIVLDIANLLPKQLVVLLYVTAGATITSIVITYLINRYWVNWVASSFFLLSLTVAMAFSDQPKEIAQGRSLILFTIPVIMASVLLRPYASFVTAGLAAILVTAMALVAKVEPDPFALIIFFGIALLSWLAARTMEQAIRDLRVLNVELEDRVQDRTRELAESLSQTEAILESTADGIIVFDNTGQATVANPAITGLLGRPVYGITGHDIETLMQGRVSDEDRETIVNLMQDHEVTHSGVKFKWGRRTLSASLAPVHDNADRVTGTVAVFRDFTREAEIDRMKSTFVSIASHELRTPLNAIMGYTEMLNEGVYGDLTERQRGATARLMANTTHMLGLVNNLLDRARIEAGTLALNISPFSPPQLVEGVVGVLGMMAQNKGLELTTQIGEDVPETLVGDWQRMHQILINFVNNALKFTEEGGVEVRIYMADQDHWAMAVADTGIGIPEDAQAYIFDPFRQVDDSATREYGGAGLGLSIVKQLVEMMGGRIGLQSEVDKGSTFTVVLPLTPPETEPEEVEGTERPVPSESGAG